MSSLQFLGIFAIIVAYLSAVRRHLSENEVARAVQMVEDGFTQREVATRLGVSQSVIQRAVERYRETGRYSRRPGQGRPRATTPRQDRYLRTLTARNRFHTAGQLQGAFQDATGVRVSTQTVRNRLHQSGLHARRPCIVSPLTAAHRRARLDFAQEHVGWQLRHWTPVLFTNESRFCLSVNDRRARVWRARGERFDEANMVEHDHFGGGSVMVWGGISIAGHTDLHVFARGGVNAQRYLNEVLIPIVRPYAGAVGDNFVLMDDNARPHRARVVNNFLEQEGIERMEWPARSPDLNPIEHLWDQLQRAVLRQPRPPQTVQELENALRRAWAAIAQEAIRRLIRSMPRRCRDCIRVRGGHTRY